MTLHALVGDQVRRPFDSGEAGRCTHCGEPMRGKVGEIVIPHWAHVVADGCDPWSAGESDWHLGWKQRLADVGCQIERTIERSGDRHRADAINPHGVIIELQHGYLAPNDIRAREQFYGAMAWVYDAREWWKQGRIVLGCELPAGGRGFRFRNGAKSLAQHRRELLFDFGDERCAKAKVSLVRHGRSERMVGKLWIRSTDEWLGALERRHRYEPSNQFKKAVARMCGCCVNELDSG